MKRKYFELLIFFKVRTGHIYSVIEMDHFAPFNLIQLPMDPQQPIVIQKSLENALVNDTAHFEKEQ